MNLRWLWGQKEKAEASMRRKDRDIDMLLKAIWEAEPAPFPIESVPSDGSPIAILSNDGIRDDGMLYGGDGKLHLAEAYPGLCVLLGASHWKPLPEPRP